jgi:HAE1 family hydrophobic/amphiphilic exporter-1
MGLTRLAVFRPVVALTVTVALLLFGVLSYFSLGLEQNPQLKLPIVTVQVVYPGASAQTVEEQVTRRVEDAIAGLGNIKTLSSTSRIGVATITVEFHEGINVDVAANDVQQRVSGVRREMPADVEEPSYFKLDFNDTPILYLAVTGNGESDGTDLYRLADDVIRQRLETVGGVGRVELVGGREPEVQVEVLPDRLRAYGLSISDVTNAVRTQFMSASGGEVRSGLGGGTSSTTLRIDSRETDSSASSGRGLAALGDMPVNTQDGASTELRNVARIYLGGKEAEQILRLNGKQAAGLLVYKQSNANITQTVDAVLPIVANLNEALPSGYQLETAIDMSAFIRQTVTGVQEELLLAAVITGIVLFLFLHSLRSTVIVLLAIPTSMLVALIVMRMSGLTLNMMTLIALTTAIGVLVDDSIVVLENIFTHLEQRKDPKQAAVDGRSEIGMAAIAITLVDVAVWGPIVFMSGIVGAFLRNFAVVMVAATLASLLVSFTLTPLIASRWLRASRSERESGRAGERRKESPRPFLVRLATFWEPAYRAVERGYGRALPWSLRHRPLVLLLSGLVFASNVIILPRIGTEFVPDTDSISAIVVGELPPGTALEAAEGAAKRWERVLLDHEQFPEIHTAYVVVGRGNSDFEREARFISITLALSETNTRERRSQDIARAVAAAGEQAVPGLQARLSSGGDGGGQPVQVRIFGDDLDQLTALAGKAQASLGAQPGLVDVTNSMSAAPELTIKPDPSRLRDMGLNTLQVSGAIRTAYQGAVVGSWTEPGGKERDVLVRLPDEVRRGVNAVADLPLIRRSNQMVTVRQVATTDTEDKPSKIMRVNRQRIALIGADPDAVPLGTATELAKSSMDSLSLPAGNRWAFAGESEDQADSFQQLGIGLGLSILLMYMVLTVLYESPIYPLVVLTALPLATVGAFLGLLTFGSTLSLPSLIGVVALFGLVGKNSILLVDRTNDLRRQGLDRTAALEQAGPSRLRPIIMTSAVLILSMLPVALKLGDGGEVRAPIGAVLVGGMATSTLLSLLFVPVIYTYFDNLQTLLGGLFRWRPRLVGQRKAVGERPEGLEAAREVPGSPQRQAALRLKPVAGGAPTAKERARGLRGTGRRRRGGAGRSFAQHVA